MKRLSRSMMAHKKITIVGFASLLILSAAVVAVFVVVPRLKSDTDGAKGRPKLQMHTKWTKPNSTEIDWERFNAMPQYNFGLNAEGEMASKPVKGQLQVKLDPSTIAKLPKTLKVYKIVPLVQSESEFRRIAARFGLKGDMKPGYICIETDDGNSGLSYNPEMDELRFDDREKRASPMNPPDVPSKEDCMKIAMRIAREKKLLPPGAKAVAASAEVGTIGGGERVYTINRTVVICVDDVDGYKIRGTGMQLRMDIVDKGEFSFISDNLRWLESYGTFPLKPIEQAIAEAQAGNDTVNIQFDVENPTVTALDVFYYSDSSNRKNGLLMPVYALMGKDCCIYVPAVNQK